MEMEIFINFRKKIINSILMLYQLSGIQLGTCMLVLYALVVKGASIKFLYCFSSVHEM